jgi:hypothetical protein
MVAVHDTHGLPLHGLPLLAEEPETATEDSRLPEYLVGRQVTPPDGKDFKIYFDKESGLPVKVVAKQRGFKKGKDLTEEATYHEYKDFGGVKRATRMEIKRDGNHFLEQQITGFRVLSKVDPKLFAER